MHILSAIVGSILLGSAVAQKVIEELSFGHKQPISPNSFSIPGWSILGEGHVPQILSDKVVMTPPAGGNKRGALWAEKKTTLKEWIADFDFRVGGQDRGGGNLQLWYVKDGSSKVSTGSLYTTSKFEGLVIVIDSIGGTQKIRGFLNDGNTDYKSHHTVESLAFGHCDYNYRNLGRPSKLQIKSGASGLSLTIDGTACFSTPKVTLPADYNFGITAASADPPDSFEVFKLAISSSASTSNSYTDAQQSVVDTGSGDVHTGSWASQFEDLHDRIQAVAKSVDSLAIDIQSTQKVQQEMLALLRSSNVQGAMDSKLNNVDRLVGEIHRDIKATDHKAEYDKLNQQIAKTHEGITEHIPGRLRDYVQNHTPRIGFIAFCFMAFQSCCLAVLLFQKYRKSTMPKKFL